MEEIEVLIPLYKILYNCFIREGKKITNNSILFTLMTMKIPQIESTFRQSCRGSEFFGSNKVDVLINRGLLRYFDEDENGMQYVLTARAIWLIDKRNSQLDEEILVDFLQDKYFPSISVKKISDKDRIALLALISIRNFTKVVSMTLDDKRRREEWLKIFKTLFEFLNEKKIFKKHYSSFEEFIGNNGTEESISYLMRRRNSLSITTNQIFRNPGGKYWLELISPDGALETYKLKQLLRLIFVEISSISLAQEISTLIIDVANNSAKYVRKDRQYVDPDTDSIIITVIKELYIEQ
jgi:hypothetical protein